MSRRTEDLEREFEGYDVLNKLLAESGAIADAQDVADAFAQAAKDGVAPPDVIHDLWIEEPRFERPAHAARLFGNLPPGYARVAAICEWIRSDIAYQVGTSLPHGTARDVLLLHYVSTQVANAIERRQRAAVRRR